eukprot:s6843_g4.t1
MGTTRRSAEGRRANMGLADEPGEHQPLPTARVETDAHSECLPEEVVAAGGSAHVVTFARLGAINAPAVRDHFPRLLESGVPEAVLLHTLAPAVDVDEPEPVTEKEFCQRKAVGRVGAPPLVAAAWEYPRSAGTEGDPLGGPPALSRDGP